MKNEKNTNEMTNIFIRVIIGKNGKVIITYTLPGLLLRTQILEKLITQYSNN